MGIKYLKGQRLKGQGPIRDQSKAINDGLQDQ